MGCDIHIYAEGYIKPYPKKEKRWININHWYRTNGWGEVMIEDKFGFDYDDLIEHRRDYDFFYLLAGVRGREEEKTYPPISEPKGLPEQMDEFVLKYETENFEIELGSIDFHDASYLTLRELKESGYGEKMYLKGWVWEDEYQEFIEHTKQEKKENDYYGIDFADIKADTVYQEGRVLKEWKGYLNGTLFLLIKNLEKLKKERQIENDDEIRIVFWFDN